MTLRKWAIKPGELKSLERGALVLFAARCSLRAEPWIPRSAAAEWGSSLELVVRAAFAPPLDAAATRARRRALSDFGALASNRLAGTDEPLGRCLNYATSTLALAIDATTGSDRPSVVKQVIDAAKHSASLFAVWAHAGRAMVEPGIDPVDQVCTATWTVIRTDIPALSTGGPALSTSVDPVASLRALAPLWPGGAPSWAVPPPASLPLM